MKNACGIFKAIYEKDKAYMMPPLYICSGLHKAYNSYLRGRLLYISASLFTTVTYRQRGRSGFIAKFVSSQTYQVVVKDHFRSIEPLMQRCNASKHQTFAAVAEAAGRHRSIIFESCHFPNPIYSSVSGFVFSWCWADHTWLSLTR